MSMVARAEAYFGYRDRPHTSIYLAPDGCLLVAEQAADGGRTLLMHYTERYGKRDGTFTRLTEKQRDKLIQALGA